MHIPLSRHQILVASQLLNGRRRRAAHRQMRTEGVPQHVDTLVLEARSPGRPTNQTLHNFLRQGPAVPLAEHPLTAEMPMGPERCGQPRRQVDIA